MYQWLVTVRAADGENDRVRAVLRERLLPLLQAQEGCAEPRLAACVNCAGEHTYLATWSSLAAVEALEGSAAYRAVLENLTPLLRVPPKRELWDVLAD